MAGVGISHALFVVLLLTTCSSLLLVHLSLENRMHLLQALPAPMQDTSSTIVTRRNSEHSATLQAAYAAFRYTCGIPNSMPGFTHNVCATCDLGPLLQAGYAAFGEHTRDIITLNLPEDWSTVAVKLSLCVGLLFTFPVMMVPVYEILERSLQSKVGSSCTPVASLTGVTSTTTDATCVHAANPTQATCVSPQ